ncbi:DUF2637 domain-containing protein [Kitasatospora phosalacinea]|uniref:DUF2637 domain-containing protein n=1 Tax=Kitasatospora phosalacinea TaxID=2065 RepID=UPI002553AC08|nr:DUF2637 domain-containing protein [Kitasatospora phosalacinea]
MTPQQIRSAERVLSWGTWAITFGAVLYSMLTVTPLMSGHTPAGWEWTAPILPLVVDWAVVIVVRMDGILARLGAGGGRWPLVLRWMTGLATLLLNVGQSALDGDRVGVAVHAVAPLLLIVTAETSLAYRSAIARAVAAREAAERAEREERQARAEQERQRARAERLEEFEQAERRRREEAEREERRLREQREHELRMAREAREAQERREAAERAEQARREAAEKAERERREREVSERERVEREREQQRAAAIRARTEELLSGPPATEKVSEELAKEIVGAAVLEKLPQRRAVELTGWSTGWVAARYRELENLHALLTDAPFRHAA